ncbi:FMN-linked oxidoreductase [Ramaria rubella]|nr:FMN-linked oxidoreductase [Ramaria rubella]
MTVSNSVLFQPIKIGRSQLQHRVAMAPLTRYKANKHHVHTDLALEYYSQRGSTPGTLLITEGTFISPGASGFDNVPGIYNADQIAAWKRITDAVHAKGSFMYLQLWALGRAAKPELLRRDGGLPYVGVSSDPLPGRKEAPRPLTVSEIQQLVQDYAQAARNAIEAGFDGVEIHGANGYIIDQFLQDVTNNRTDEYGGSVEGRSRFGLEVVKAITEAVGEDRTAIRLSPWSTFQGMGMKDPIPQFSHIIQSIRNLYPDFAYIHLVEPEVVNPEIDSRSNDHFRQLWAPKPFLSANNHTAESAPVVAERKGDVVVFGRYFISNPDLPLRLKSGIPLAPYNYETFYLTESAIGYIDYPFAEYQDELQPKDVVQPHL